MTLNIPDEENSLVGSTGNQLEKVNDFVYLGAWIATTYRGTSGSGKSKDGWLAISSKGYGSRA